jgi:hypothetical protein
MSQFLCRSRCRERTGQRPRFSHRSSRVDYPFPTARIQPLD